MGDHFLSRRDFAYVHTAVYVGMLEGKHYVVENAGCDGSREEGSWLELRGAP